MDAPTVIGPTVGPRVMGEKAYREAVAAATVTGGGRVGSRLTGPLGGAARRAVLPVGPKVEDTAPVLPAVEAQAALPLGSVSVLEAQARIRAPGADLRAAWAQEHARPNGPRKTVLATLAELGVHAAPVVAEANVGPAVEGPDDAG